MCNQNCVQGRKCTCANRGGDMSKEPVAWVTPQDLLDMQANAIMGVKDWSLTVGLVEQKGDVPLYTIPPEQPTKIFGPNLEELLNGAGFYRKKEWVGLTDAEATELWKNIDNSWELIMQVQKKLQEKNK